MSDLLRVRVVEQDQSARNLVKRFEILPFVRRRREGTVPENMLQHFRVEQTRTRRTLDLEPFVGPASCRALLQDKRKRPRVWALVTAVVEWGWLFSDTVGIAFIEERRKPTPALPERESSLRSLYERSPRAAHELVWLQREWTVFHAAVQARLDQPLTIEGNRPAVGFWRNYGLTAQDAASVEPMLHSRLALEHASIASVDPKPILFASLEPDIQSKAGCPCETGIWYESGRVLFPDD
jgi:hypothetical protein